MGACLSAQKRRVQNRPGPADQGRVCFPTAGLPAGSIFLLPLPFPPLISGGQVRQIEFLCMIRPQPGAGGSDVQTPCQLFHRLRGAAEEALVAPDALPEGDPGLKRDRFFRRRLAPLCRDMTL